MDFEHPHVVLRLCCVVLPRSVPAAIKGRDSFDIEVYGMSGVPADVIARKQAEETGEFAQRVLTMFFLFAKICVRAGERASVCWLSYDVVAG